MKEFTVTEKAMRPASPKRECFYCHSPIGATHKEGCVLIRKQVVVTLTIAYPVSVPADWDKDQIEFNRNDGTWCAGNLVDELDNLKEDLDKEGRCMCRLAHFECPSAEGEPYLRED